jgi:hypothetical protein
MDVKLLGDVHHVIATLVGVEQLTLLIGCKSPSPHVSCAPSMLGRIDRR